MLRAYNGIYFKVKASGTNCTLVKKYTQSHEALNNYRCRIFTKRLPVEASEAYFAQVRYHALRAMSHVSQRLLH